MYIRYLILLACAIVAFGLAACGGGSATAPTAVPGTAPSGSLTGQQLMTQRCTSCHSADRITSAHHTKEQWAATVANMTRRGAKLNADETQILIDYLAANYK
jgi:hypothetical protein